MKKKNIINTQTTAHSHSRRAAKRQGGKDEGIVLSKPKFEKC